MSEQTNNNNDNKGATANRLPQKLLKHKRRYCKVPECTKIVKSQGLCQRHGAKPKFCKVVSCKKQAQGNFDGMCKSHFKAFKQVKNPLPPKPIGPPPEPQGESVYDRIIPDSIKYKPSSTTTMPFVQYLKDNFDRGTCWHRNDERRARGLHPVHAASVQLEVWERELVWMEILLLAGNVDTSYRHLARAWGRDKGFQTVLTNFICERSGNMERKRQKVFGNIVANVWDDACYNSRQANEALAATLFQGLFDDATASTEASTEESAGDHPRQVNSTNFVYTGDGEDPVGDDNDDDPIPFYRQQSQQEANNNNNEDPEGMIYCSPVGAPVAGNFFRC